MSWIFKKKPMEEAKSLSVVKDPFNKNSVRRIWFCASDWRGDGEWIFSGSVEFQNGLTKGEQDFKGKSIEDVITQLQSFLEELANNR